MRKFVINKENIVLFINVYNFFIHEYDSTEVIIEDITFRRASKDR